MHGLRRDAVDDILAERAAPVRRRNRTVSLKVDHRVADPRNAVARPQLSSDLILSKVPVTSNGSTPGRFGSHLSLFSLGLRFDL